MALSSGDTVWISLGYRIAVPAVILSGELNHDVTTMVGVGDGTFR